MIKNHRCKTLFLCVGLVTALLFFPANAAGMPGPDGNPSDGAKPLKVFILAGQSNMQGHAHVLTFDHIGMDPETAPLLQAMRGGTGKPRVCRNVWITSLSRGGVKQGRLTAGFGADENKIGPEFTFGIYAAKLLGEPILIIKTAWGGKSLHTDFRPPGAGPYAFSKAQLEKLEKQGKDLAAIKAEKAKATGHYYRLMVDHVKKVLANIKRVYPGYARNRGHELAGFVWFQGWNDMVDGGAYPDRHRPGGYDRYSVLLAQFIRDVRKDLSAPKLPFVIGVMGVGGPVDEYSPKQKRYKRVHQNFRLAMAAPAGRREFNGTVAAVWTEKCWDQQLAALRSRDAEIKRNVKALRSTRKLSRRAEEKELAKQRARGFTPRERKILETGVSNAEFHYLGSAKIMARIGKAFAEAAVGLMKPQQHAATRFTPTKDNPDFARGGKIPKGATHDWNLGPTGVRGWMYGNKLETTEARQIYVTKVEAGSPAAGVLRPGDVILGVAGRSFAYDPRTELGKAVSAAESADGSLL